MQLLTDAWEGLRHYVIARTGYIGADADDVIQDVALKIFARPHNVLEAQNPRAYLLVMTRNALSERYRQQARREFYAWDRAVPAFSAEAADLNLSQWENEQFIAQLLAPLPPRQRQVLQLIISGYTPAEISQQLSMPVSAVRSNLRHARVKLQEQLRQHPEELDLMRGIQ